MNDRRQVPRWPIRREGRVFLDGVESAARCCVEDLNLKGACLSLSEEWAPGRVVKMALSVDNGLFIDVEARVPWVKEREGRYRHGLVFTRIMDGDRENIYQFMNNNFPRMLRSGWWDAPDAPTEP